MLQVASNMKTFLVYLQSQSRRMTKQDGSGRRQTAIKIWSGHVSVASEHARQTKIRNQQNRICWLRIYNIYNG